MWWVCVCVGVWGDNVQAHNYNKGSCFIYCIKSLLTQEHVQRHLNISLV